VRIDEPASSATLLFSGNGAENCIGSRGQAGLIGKNRSTGSVAVSQTAKNNTFGRANGGVEPVSTA